MNKKGIPTTPATRRSLRIMNSSTQVKKAIASSVNRRKEQGKTKSQDEASSSGHQPVRPSTRSSSSTSTPVISLQAGNAVSKIISLTPDLGLMSNDTKKEPAGSNMPQGHVDIDVDELADDISSLSGVDKHHSHQTAALKNLARNIEFISKNVAGQSKKDFSKVFSTASPQFRAIIGVDDPSAIKPDTPATKLLGSGQQPMNKTYVVKAEHPHDASKPLSPHTRSNASQSGRDLKQSSLYSFFRVKKHGKGVPTQPRADSSAPTAKGDTIPPTNGVLEPINTGNSQNGCNVPHPTPQQDKKGKATTASHGPGAAIGEGGAERTCPSPHRSHSKDQTHRASQVLRGSPDADVDSPDGESCYDSEERLLYGQPARRAHKEIRHVTGVNAVKPPHFTSVSAMAMKGTRRKILDYEDRVRNHNQIHGLDNKPLRVLFMLKEGLARALIEEILKPNELFDSNNASHQRAIRDYMFQKQNTPRVNSHIKIDMFEREMRRISMDMNDKSLVSRTMTFLNKVTLLLEDTCVTITDKN